MNGPRDNLAAALQLHGLGWSIIPLCHPKHAGPHSQAHKGACNRPGKMPVARWADRQITPYSATELNTIWTRNPALNLGVVTGRVSGIVMVDIDTDEGERAWTQQWSGADDPTWEFGTGRGGRHLVYRIHPDCVPRANPFPDLKGHLDFLGEGRQSVIPPSLHRLGTAYEWRRGGPTSGVPLADAPERLVRAVLASAPAESRGPVGGVRGDADFVAAVDATRVAIRAMAWTRGFEPAVSGGGGHDVAFRLACSLVHGFGLSDDDALSLMVSHWNDRCSPPWAVGDLVHKVASARSSGSFRHIDQRPLDRPATTTARVSAPPAPPASITHRPAVNEPADLGVLASDLHEKQASYFFEPWIPRGTLTLLAGRPGAGKSTFLAFLSSKSTNAIYLVGEEDPRGALLHRLDRHGVGRGRVRTVTASRDFRLPDAIPRLERQLTKDGANLLLMDPVKAFLPAGCKEGDNDSVADALYALGDLAHRTGVTIVGIKHPGKAAGNVLRGAAAWLDIPRTVVELVRDPGPPTQYMIRHEKNNEPGGMAPTTYYELQGEHQQPRLFVLGKPVDSLEAEMAAETQDKLERMKIDEAMEFLRGCLANGEVESSQVFKQGEGERLAERTIRRAAMRLGIVTRREGAGKEHRSLWALPPATPQEGTP